jgi:Protein of unknown function (DUF4241)
MRSAGIRVPLATAAVSAMLVVGACVSPFPPLQQPGAAPLATFPSRADLDPEADCVASPDPANGGHPAPPDAVIEAGDPADPTGVVAIEVVGVGDLVLPSDQLLVADLFFLGGDPAELEAIDLDGFAGPAAVCLHLARYDSSDERVAFVHVRLTEAPVVAWREAGGFGVDGGTGGIASSGAVIAAGSRVDGIIEQYIEELERHQVNTWTWLNIELDPATGGNVIGFSTGFGDGGYPVVIGADAEGRPASVVIDHVVVPWAWLSRVGPVH